MNGWHGVIPLASNLLQDGKTRIALIAVADTGAGIEEKPAGSIRVESILGEVSKCMVELPLRADQTDVDGVI